MRVKFVAGNWKMNGSLSANDTLLKDLVPALAALTGMESAVCPPYPYLAQVQCALQGSPVALGGQDLCQFGNGAYTGGVSAAMLKEFGWARADFALMRRVVEIPLRARLHDLVGLLDRDGRTLALDHQQIGMGRGQGQLGMAHGVVARPVRREQRGGERPRQRPLAAAARRGLGRDPALVPPAIDDLAFDRLDGHRSVRDVQGARGLAGGGAHIAQGPGDHEAVVNGVGRIVEIADDRRRIAEDASRRLQSDLDGFIRESVASLRDETARLATEVLATIDGSENGVHQRTLNRLTTFIDSFRTLNFAGDQQLEQTLERFRRELLGRSAEDYRANSGAMTNLTDGLSRLRESAVQLARSDAREVVSRFGQQGGRKLAAVG